MKTKKTPTNNRLCNLTEYETKLLQSGLPTRTWNTIVDLCEQNSPLGCVEPEVKEKMYQMVWNQICEKKINYKRLPIVVKLLASFEPFYIDDPCVKDYTEDRVFLQDYINEMIDNT